MPGPWSVTYRNPASRAVRTGLSAARASRCCFTPRRCAIFMFDRRLQALCRRRICGPSFDLVDRMRDEHERIGVELLRIRRLTNGYAPPPGASAAYRAMIGALWELEANLQLAMREEDEILFAKALTR